MVSNVARLPHRSVRYLEAGGDRGIVLLHAFPLNADQWLPQLHRPPAGWRVLAPDLRGFGLTGAVDTLDVTLDDFADDVLALMGHLDISRAVIAGVSMGGYVALALAARARERVAGLLLANTRASADSEDGRAARARMLDELQRDGVAAVARDLLPKLLGRTSRERQPDLADAVERLIHATSAEGLAAAVRAMRDRPDRSALLATLDCPSVVLTGGEDPLIAPAEAAAMRDRLPDAELVTLPHAGHLSNLEDVAGFNAALTRLLARVEARHTL